MLLPINPAHPEPRKIAQAVRVIEDGGIIAYPTDTVYGIGCDLHNKQAIERLYQMKGMPRKKPLALICPDLSNIAKYAIVDNQTYRVLKHFLPGPYCFVLQATREVPRFLHTKQKTVGIRVPDHPVTHALVSELGRPVVSTTAMESSLRSSSKTARISRIVSRLKAFLFSGLLMVIFATPCADTGARLVDVPAPR